MTDVVLASGSYSPREGGAERQMRSILESAEVVGISTLVVTRVLEGEPRSSVIGGVQVVRVGFGWAFRRVPPVGRAVFVLWLLVRLILARPRTIVSIQLGTASVAAAIAARLVGARHIVRLTGGGTADHRSEPLAKRSSIVGRLGVLLAARPSTVIVAPARHLLADFASAFPSFPAQLVHVPNGTSPPSETLLRHDDKRSGVVWYSRRGAESSANVFLAVAEKGADLQFRSIGKTLLSTSSNVENLGWVDEPFTVMGTARVLLNTSPTEGMPNTVLQALAAGMWVVGPRNQGLVELDEDYPGRITFADLSDPLNVANVLTERHAMPLPSPVRVTSAEDVAAKWFELLNGDKR